jgi:hypothetical protein
MRIFLLLGLLLSPLALADTIEPSHDCNQPDVPYEFQNQYERDQFRADVDEYKTCITDFVEEQQDAIRKHNSAADDAIEEWNSFARST